MTMIVDDALSSFPAASSSGQKVAVSRGTVDYLEGSIPCPDARPPVEGASISTSSPARPVISSIFSLASLFQTPPVMSVQVRNAAGQSTTTPSISGRQFGLHSYLKTRSLVNFLFKLVM